MNLLKYLDILIGLAVVMVLLSPLVTAITQLILWICRFRSMALLRGLQDLIRHLDAPPLAEYGAADVQITPGQATDVAIGRGPTRRTDETGRVRYALLPETVPTGGSLTVRVGGGQRVAVTLIPKLSGNDQKIAGAVANGAARISYRFAGPAAYASRRANVSVLDGSDRPVGATVAWTIDPALDGGAGEGRIATTPEQPGTFQNPPTPKPGGYDLTLTVAPPAGVANAPEPAKVVFEFQRNADFDVTQDGPVDHGLATLPLPKHAITRLGLQDAKALAGKILLHPMIAGPGFFGKVAKGNVIEREELIRILLELAAAEADDPVFERIRTALQHVLARNGIPFPEASLAAIRAKALEQERNDPAAATHVRQTRAILQAASSDFVAKINGWFDQTMDRVSSRYTLYARVFTVAASFLVAFALQTDSLQLLKRLSTDDQFRASLLQEAEAQQKRIDALTPSVTTKTTDTKTGLTTETKSSGEAGSSGSAIQEEWKAAKEKRDEIEQNLSKLRQPQMAIVPDHLPYDWQDEYRLGNNANWKAPLPVNYQLSAGGRSFDLKVAPGGNLLANLKSAIDQTAAPVKTTLTSNALLLVTRQPRGSVALRAPDGANLLDRQVRRFYTWQWMLEGQSWIGVIVTAMLMSLGAPFWYDSLKDLLKLRPALASKEEQQRNDRMEDTTETEGK